MHILITWATWLIGSQLVHHELKRWNTVSILTTSPQKAQKMFWPQVEVVSRTNFHEKIEWVGVVIHLAWSSLMQFPWSKSVRKKIYKSRIKTTRRLVQSLPDSCHTFICASAVWYYPSHPTKLYSPDWKNKNPWSFLEKVCVDREAEAMRWKSESRRVVLLRSWTLIWKTLFSKIMNLQTKVLWWVILGDWKQRLSVCTLEDWILFYDTIISHPTVYWPVNMVSESLQYRTFIDRLAKRWNRTVSLRISAPLIRFFMWEFSMLVLSSIKAQPFKTTFKESWLIEET